MEAKAASLYFVGEYKELIIPFFQRNYVWEEENWNELLNSLENKDVVPYLGTVILKTDNDGRKMIIDGQQRLTTIFILVKALYDSFDESQKARRTKIQDFLFFKENTMSDDSNWKTRIRHSLVDREDFNRVIKAGFLSDDNIIDSVNSNSRIINCYKYFYNRFLEYSIERKRKLYDLLFDTDRKVLVLLNLSFKDINEQSIFDTINRAGVRLSTAEIIKNNLFKYLLDTCGENEKCADDIIDKYEINWHDTFYKDSETISIWEEERVFGNVKHTNLDFILYCVACIRWGLSSDSFSKLENVYETNMKVLDKSELLQLLFDIKKYALIFREFILDFKKELNGDDSVYFTYSDHVKRLLLILEVFGVQMFYPYVIMRISEANSDFNNKELIHDFSILESFIVRRKISGKGTHDYTMKCNEIIQNGIGELIKTDLGNNSSTLSNDDVKRYLSYTKDDAAKMILFWVELYKRSSSKFDEMALPYGSYSLEHIMPKKWEKNWSNVVINDGYRVYDVNSDEGRLIRSEHIQSIGNKTLLTVPLNSTVKNASFYDKIEGVGKDKGNKEGYRKYASLLITKEIVEKASESGYLWDEGHIDERRDSIYKLFITIWPDYASDVITSSVIPKAIDVNDFTEEELKNPILLADKLEILESINESDNLISEEELVMSVFVSREKVRNDINNGALIPYSVGEGNNHKQIRYFTPEAIDNYIDQYGLERITNENRKDLFWKMTVDGSYSYSYKMVLIKAILELSTDKGVVDMNEVVQYFKEFYYSRKKAGKTVEQKDSIFVKDNISNKMVQELILTYPYRRYRDIGALEYDSSKGKIIISESVWRKMTPKEKKQLKTECDRILKEYYIRISKSNHL